MILKLILAATAIVAGGLLAYDSWATSGNMTILGAVVVAVGIGLLVKTLRSDGSK